MENWSSQCRKWTTKGMNTRSIWGKNSMVDSSQLWPSLALAWKNFEWLHDQGKVWKSYIRVHRWFHSRKQFHIGSSIKSDSGCWKNWENILRNYPSISITKCIYQLFQHWNELRCYVVRWFCSWLGRLITQIWVHLILILGTVPITVPERWLIKGHY